ncbi:Sua5/YciO/YrdC/YwlC family protein [Campylobacter sp. RM12327]|uniref:Sua5/YciO/YrdC/YwlC family protein n=1 Tax=Campylobacter sputorum TaxID=206 RepID=UPI000B781D77|nr:MULTISPECIES: Sua5/YciO/YrdC/YwlC family protein [Campylobacter]ASM39524.1 threonylcarbamoyl-AMP synthase TsaC [Campylobacter sputorum]MBE7358428.1 Sua5/YciO/YrdC/YwlC family protein [Campylobacter sp. RM11302]MBF6670114.1 Sua5/YciO/YrdC/YwlC family protein [Campylobacter sp. RM12327]MBF6675240.1 Sua5/YciO/YrdC/YwlC family protein [Campylobacter sp. RM13538]MBF6676860.1 Sua5/YciO/YrdC/YwlC family protein [Campylobacter sp. RM12321]
MIYLAQTDTTAGFLSKNLKELNKIKNRNKNQPCLITVSKLKELNKLTRIPDKFKNLVRKAKKTTFLYPNKKAIRVVKNSPHSKFLDEHGWMYSTSANLHGEKFDLNYAKSVCDIVVDNEFFEDLPSKIYKISNTNIKKIR